LDDSNDAIDVYSIKLSNLAYKDLDEIYAHIANTLIEPSIASNIVERAAVKWQYDNSAI
jgi:hypothetical protein